MAATDGVQQFAIKSVALAGLLCIGLTAWMPAKAESLPVGSQTIWRSNDPENNAPDQIVTFYVLASGPHYTIETDARPFAFSEDDYAVFIVYRELGYIDCLYPENEERIRTDLEGIDILWQAGPLKPGYSTKRFSIAQTQGKAGANSPAPEGSPLLSITDRNTMGSDTDVFMTTIWSQALNKPIRLNYSNGYFGEMITIRTAPQPDEAGKPQGSIPPICRKNLPQWLWKRIGAE